MARSTTTRNHPLLNVCGYLALALASCTRGVWSPPAAPDELEPGAPAQDQRAIVRLTARWLTPENTTEESFGTGIILGYVRFETSLYIMTARHVVYSPEWGAPSEVVVRFRTAPMVDVPAKVVRIHDAEDFAVVRVERSLDEIEDQSIAKLRLPPPGLELRPGDRIQTISHPGAQRWVDKPSTIVRTEANKIVFERGEIDAGSSGGAVLSSDRRLLGMITSVEGPLAFGLSVRSILEILAGWHIPYRMRLMSDVKTSLFEICDAVWRNETPSFVGVQRPAAPYDLAPVYTSKRNLFGGTALIVGDLDREWYFLEEVGVFRGKTAREEARRLVIREVALALPDQYGVKDNRVDTVDFRYFKAFRGTVIVRVYEFSWTIFVIVAHNDIPWTIRPPAYLDAHLDALRAASEGRMEAPEERGER